MLDLISRAATILFLANVPYFSGRNGVARLGGNTGPRGSFVPGNSTDLVKRENRYTMGILVKY